MTQRLADRVHERLTSGDSLVAIDCFCGAGGLSYGFLNAVKRIAARADISRSVDDLVEVHAINHDHNAIRSHADNFPWANHYCQDIRTLDLDALELSPGSRVDVFIGAPDCTQYSTAKGGGQKDRDKRHLPTQLLSYIKQFDVRSLLIENVEQFRSSDPLDATGTETQTSRRNTFSSFTTALAQAGFTLDHRTLCCSDYGDPTSRKRLFILGTRTGGISWPTQAASPGNDASTSAASIIDWHDCGESLWLRDATNSRITPPVTNTARRFADGIERHCTNRYQPLATLLRDYTPGDIDRLRNTAIHYTDAPARLATTTEPFLIHNLPRLDSTDIIQQSTSSGREQNGQSLSRRSQPSVPVGLPESFDIARGISLAKLGTERIQSDATSGPTATPGQAFVLRQQKGGRPPAVTEPLPTIAKAGAIQLVVPVSSRLSLGIGLSDDITTVPVDDQPPALGDASARYPQWAPQEPACGLVVPAAWPRVFDLRFRMLTLPELKAAHSFPSDYTLIGSQADQTRYIGNSVPTQTATALLESLLVEREATLADPDPAAI